MAECIEVLFRVELTGDPRNYVLIGWGSDPAVAKGSVVSVVHCTLYTGTIFPDRSARLV